MAVEHNLRDIRMLTEDLEESNEHICIESVLVDLSNGGISAQINALNPNSLFP